MNTNEYWLQKRILKNEAIKARWHPLNVALIVLGVLVALYLLKGVLL